MDLIFKIIALTVDAMFIIQNVYFIISSMSQSRNYCFTLNNPTEREIELLELAASSLDDCYLIYGKETGEEGTPHLQGFIRFPKKKRFSGAKAFVSDRAHIEVAKNVPASIQYCKKDGDFKEIGEYSPDPGKRSDLEAFKDDVKAGTLSISTLYETHSSVAARYPRFVTDYINLQRKPKEITLHPLKEWQSVLYQKLARSPDDRTITFVVDQTGNQGKSWFCKYYSRLHADTQVIKPGKKADMSYILRCDIRTLMMDAPRSKQGEFVQYDFLEEVKDGYVFSSKYESQMKLLSQNVHVVVMMNEYPDMSKLSEDRYDIQVIN